MLFLNTKQLSAHINALYKKIESITKSDSVYTPITARVVFSESGFYDDIFYVYSDSDGYHCNYVERGKIRRTYVTKDLFDVSYYVLERCVSSMSVGYAVLNQNGHSQRSVAFGREIEYMRIIGEEYAQRCKEEIDKILETAPYSDGE